MSNVKKGDKIVIIEMSGEPNYWGRVGVVTCVDDAGNLHGTWGSLAVLPNIDKFIVVKEG